MKKMTTKRRYSLLALVLGLLAVCVVSSVSAEDAEALAAALSKIRIETEALSQDVDARRDDMKNRLHQVAAQKAELEMELAREEMRLKQLRVEKAERIAAVSDDTNRDALLEPVVMRSVDTVKAAVEKGLPFKKEERVDELEKIRAKRNDGLLSSADAVARLWDRVEDELRLAKENGIYRQTVTVNGEEMLVDVARIGMVMLFYKTKDGRVGKAVERDGEWRYEPIERPEDVGRVELLFDSFKKQIRTGFFELPDALPQKGDAP